MPIVDIEFQERARERLGLFIERAAQDIAEGYGAGNCTPESEAFWTLYPVVDVSEGWCLLRIEIEGESLSDREIGIAVRKVGTAPKGEIEIFGKKVGRWHSPTDLPTRKDGFA